MDNIGQQILSKIKEQNIQPKKRWQFWFKNFILWLVFVLAIVFGSLASSATIFMIKHAGWSSHVPNFHPLKKLLVDLPFFWLLSLLIFSLIAWYDFKNTKRGYKYHPLLIVFVNVILSIVVGALIYQGGVGEKLEEVFFRRVPFYQQMFRHGGRMFVEPDKGHLAGVVVSVDSELITVEDFRGDVWAINTSTDQFRPGQRVILIGRMSQDNHFICENIEPWLKPRGQMSPPRFFRP